MKHLALAGLLLAAAPVMAVSAQDWNATFAETQRGHLNGNPEAATKLISFVSYSCPHCANFELQSDAPLRAGYIQPGAVSLEVRHVIRNPIDLAAALIAECGPQDKFFANHRTILRAQEKWLPKATGASQAQTQRWTGGSVGSRMQAIASDLDFYKLMEPRGYTVAELDRCLSSEAAAHELAERAQADSVAFDIPGTPSFAVNGRMLPGVHSWAALQPALDNAGRNTAR